MQSYVKALMRGIKLNADGSPLKFDGLCGRICRGSQPVEFETLLGPEQGGIDQEPALACRLMGPTGLESLVDAVQRSNENAKTDKAAALPPIINMLISIGYSSLDIYRGIVKSGYSYSLVVMQADEANAKRATWDGMLEIVCECYPELAPHLRKIWARFVRDCQDLGFDRLEARYKSEGYPALSGLSEANAGQHISRARLAELGAAGELRTHHVRAWLFVTASVRKNFRGDGYTWLANGDKGSEEWIMRNRRIDEMASVIIVPLGQPTSDQVTKYVCDEFKVEQRKFEERCPDKAKMEAALKIQAVGRGHLGRRKTKLKQQEPPQPSQPRSPSVPTRLWSPTPAQFTEKLRLGEPMPPHAKLGGLCGRVCRGQRATHFLGLAELDGQRRVVFMLGADGLEMILKTLHVPLKLLLYLGYDVLFVYEEIMRGSVFDLVVIAESSEAGVVAATWDNLPSVVTASFDKNGAQLSTLVATHLPEMQMASFFDLQQAYTHPKTKAVMSMNEARRKPVSSETSDEAPWRMTENRLLQLEKCRAADVRAFLYHAMNLNNLYSGDGYTYTQEGGRGFREYLAPNKQKEDLGVEWSSCPVGMPTIDECMEEICRAYDKLILLKIMGF